MFSQSSVTLLMGGVSQHALGQRPRGKPPGQTPATTLGRHPPVQCSAEIHPPTKCMLDTHPPCQVHAGICPLPSACWDTPPSPVHAGIHARPGGHCSRRFASYWNAFLLEYNFIACLKIVIKVIFK